MSVVDSADSDGLNSLDQAQLDFRQDDEEKAGKAKGSSKVKDLSHVPCKFFRVGACTAGPSCPFSHQMHEPGQQKDVCAWFVKGNCKFGHKCALAHVLPGQSMSMDRRNKKAAQAAAAAAGGANLNGGKDKDGAGKRDKGKGQKSPSSGGTSSGGQIGGRNPMLAGLGRAPLAISKAVPAPAAPAPTLQDTDFASLDLTRTNGLHIMQKMGSSPETPRAIGNGGTPQGNNDLSGIAAFGKLESLNQSSSTLIPISTPTQPLRFTSQHGASPSIDLGPVGSPPRSSPANAMRVNGFSPATSPRETSHLHQNPLSSSPFSAPSGQSTFMPFDTLNRPDKLMARSGISTSLNAAQAFDVGSLPIKPQRNLSGIGIQLDPTTPGDDDMEEFIPSSLTDLLTPMERSRRMSRTSSANAGNATALGHSIPRPTVQEHHHRYSRSVPAPSLLNDIKSIWADTNPTQQDPRESTHLGFGTPLTNGAPSAFAGPSSMSSNAAYMPGFGEEGLSPSFLSPSNASAAFLPNLHQQFSRNSKDLYKTNTPLNSVPPALQRQATDLDGGRNTLSSSLLHSSLINNSEHNPSKANMTGRPPVSPFSEAMSPSAKALQSHAPGQSLPQGLAAGYSRIHVRAPAASPTFSSVTSTSITSGPHTAGLPGTPEWPSHSNDGESYNINATEDVDIGGLSAMFSRSSYSAAARGSSNGSHPVPMGGSQLAMSMARRPSGRGLNPHLLSSPLSGPVITNDEDLFSMDEEK